MDNPYDSWTPLHGREPVVLNDGIRLVLTLIVPIEFFPLNPPQKPFRHPGAMQTPYPDLRHYTVRDYGNRIGVYRLLREFERFGIKATFAVNSEVARRYQPLLDTLRISGHEIAAHGVSTAHIHHSGLDLETERAWIREAREAFPEAVTWMSPARNQSFETLNLLSENKFGICLDWESDIIPRRFETANGPVRMLPNYGELGDMKLLSDRSQSEDDWRCQILEAVRYSIGQYEQEGSSALSLTLTPYIVGQPFRLRAVRSLLSALTGLDGLRIATAKQSIALFEAVSTRASA